MNVIECRHDITGCPEFRYPFVVDTQSAIEEITDLTDDQKVRSKACLI